MDWLVASARNALLAGLAVTFVMLALWLVSMGGDAIGFISFLLRVLHVTAAAVWVGLIVFVNVVQLAAIEEADEAGRAVILRAMAGRVGKLLQHAAGGTIVFGLLLMPPTGYLFSGLLYGTAVHVPMAKLVMFYAGAVGGIVMWVFVHWLILPSLAVLTGTTAGDANAKAAARAKVRRYARLNMMLVAPVTVAMLAAAHLQ